MLAINIIENSLSGRSRGTSVPRVPIKVPPFIRFTTTETTKSSVPRVQASVRRSSNFKNKKTAIGEVIIGTQFADSIGILYFTDFLFGLGKSA